jgi:hypothetical protein
MHFVDSPRAVEVASLGRESLEQGIFAVLTAVGRLWEVWEDDAPSRFEW